MSSIIIDSPLAERIRAIAQQEDRPVEAVLIAMVDKYAASLSYAELIARLKEVGEITLPSDDPLEPPLNEEEELALIQRAGAGELSGAQIVIDERKQGW